MSRCQAGDGTFEFVDTSGSHVTFDRVGSTTTVSVAGYGVVGELTSWDPNTGTYATAKGGGRAPSQALHAINSWMGADRHGSSQVAVTASATSDRKSKYEATTAPRAAPPSQAARPAGCQAGDGTFEFVDTSGSHVTFDRVGSTTTVSVAGYGVVGELTSWDPNTGTYATAKGGGRAPSQALHAINSWMDAEGALDANMTADIERIRRLRDMRGR